VQKIRIDEVTQIRVRKEPYVAKEWYRRINRQIDVLHFSEDGRNEFASFHAHTVVMEAAANEILDRAKARGIAIMRE